MRPAFRIPGDTNGTAGSFASYAELADDRESLLGQLNAAKGELEQLRAWKAEAMEVLASWEKVWEAAGRPGPLGQSKALAVALLFIDGGADDRR